MRFHDASQTTAQIEKSLEPFMGKWVVYTGRVARVSVNGIYFESPTPKSPARVSAYFKEAWCEYLAIVAQGEIVAVEGRIRAIDSMFLTLDQCEFRETPKRR